jgi:hypothetical protein
MKYIPDEHHGCTGVLATKYDCGCQVHLRELALRGLVVVGYNPCFDHCLECKKIDKKDHDSFDYKVSMQIHTVYHWLDGERP